MVAKTNAMVKPAILSLGGSVAPVLFAPVAVALAPELVEEEDDVDAALILLCTKLNAS